MSIERIFGASFDSIEDQNTAVENWLVSSLERAQPALTGDFNPDPSDSEKARIDNLIQGLSAGRWILSGRDKEWRQKFGALFAAPPKRSEEGPGAKKDIKTTFPGIGLRLISLVKPPLKTKDLAVLIRDGTFYLYCPLAGLFKVPVTEAYSFFANLMDQRYAEFSDGRFDVKVVSPNVKVFNTQKSDHRIVAGIATSLRTGHISLSTDEELFALQALLQVLKYYPGRIKKIFIQCSQPQSLFIAPPDRIHFLQALFPGGVDNQHLGQDFVDQTKNIPFMLLIFGLPKDRE